MRRTRSAALAVLIFSASSLAGCIPGPLRGGGTRYGEWYATDVDVARAQSVWRDPWVAPRQSTVAHVRTKNPSNGQHLIFRTVASRDTSAPTLGPQTGDGFSRSIVLTEVAAAIAAGWLLTGADCSSTGPGLSARLRRPGSTLHSAATATVFSTRITVDVPYHLDSTWTFEPPVALSETCLQGGASTTAPADVGVTGRETTIPEADEPRWDTVFPAPALTGPLAALNADPVMKTLGITVTAPEAPGERVWQEYKAAGSGVRMKDPLQRAVSTVTSTPSSWKPTFVACWGAEGQQIVQFQRELEPGRYAVLDLRVPKASDTETVSLVHVSTPGVSLEAGSEVSLEGSCLSTGASTGGSQAAFTALGSPAFCPSELQPIFGRTNKP